MGRAFRSVMRSWQTTMGTSAFPILAFAFGTISGMLVMSTISNHRTETACQMLSSGPEAFTQALKSQMMAQQALAKAKAESREKQFAQTKGDAIASRKKDQESIAHLQRELAVAKAQALKAPASHAGASIKKDQESIAHFQRELAVAKAQALKAPASPASPASTRYASVKGKGEITQECRSRFDHYKRIRPTHSALLTDEAVVNQDKRFHDTVFLGPEFGKETNHIKNFNTRGEKYSKENGQGTAHLWGGMSNDVYGKWMDYLFDKAGLKKGGMIVDSGAGMGKTLAIAKEKLDVVGVGVEPTEVNVCMGWKLFHPATSQLYLGEADDLSMVGDGVADLALTVGVIAYFPNLAYLCRAVLEQVRVTKPGGVIIHSWVTVNVKKAADKMNVKKEFWGSVKDGALPACSKEFGGQFIDPKTIKTWNGNGRETGPGNGYGVIMRKYPEGDKAG